MVHIQINAANYATPIILRVGDLLINGAGLNIEDSKFYALTAQVKSQLAELVRQSKIIITKDNDSLGQTEVSLADTSLFSLLPKITTTQKDAIVSPSEGLIVYDTTLQKLCVYTGAAWETITST